MKQISTTAILIFLSLNYCLSQTIKFRELILIPDESTIKYERFDKFKKEVTHRNYVIYKVIDSREEKDRIGTDSKNGKINRHLKFPTPLKNEFETFISNISYNLGRNGFDSIQLEIERFEIIRESEDYKNIGSIALTLNFLSADGVLKYQYKSELKEKRVLYPYITSVQILREAMFNAFYVFNFLSNDYDQDNTISTDISNYSSIFIEKPKKGFYISIDELISNNPSIRPDFSIEKGKTPDKYNKWELTFSDPKIEENKKTFCSNIIGFSDGQDIYINALNYSSKFGFNPILTKGRYLFFRGMGPGGLTNGVDGAGTDFGSYYMTSFLFGLVGSAVLAAFSTIPTNYDAAIDLKSNKLYIVDNDFLDKIMLTVPDIKEVYDKNRMRHEPHMKEFWFKEINKRY